MELAQRELNKENLPPSRFKLKPFIQIDEKVDASEAKIDNVILPVTYKVPVTVEEEETMLTWTVDTLSEVKRWNLFSARCLLVAPNVLRKNIFHAGHTFSLNYFLDFYEPCILI